MEENVVRVCNVARIEIVANTIQRTISELPMRNVIIGEMCVCGVYVYRISLLLIFFRCR